MGGRAPPLVPGLRPPTNSDIHRVLTILHAGACASREPMLKRHEAARLTSSQTQEVEMPMPKAPSVANIPESAWHSVSIARGRHCCPAVARLNDHRWLLAEAPSLPVEGCTAKQCHCRFRHHADRRAIDRRETSGRISGPPKEGERRSGFGDRRKREL